LFIYNGYYLQNIPYIDEKIPGLAWYIVTMQPADVNADHLGPPSPLYYCAVTVSIFTIIICLASFIFTLKNRNAKLVILTQPMFVLTIQVGFVLLAISALFFLGENNTVNCSIRAYLTNIAFTIAFATILIKCYRVYIIFAKPCGTKFVTGHQTRLLMTPRVFVACVCGFVMADFILVTVSLMHSKHGLQPYTKIEVGSNHAKAQVTFCGFEDNRSFILGEVAYKSALIVGCCVLSFAIRSVNATIASARNLFVLVYNVALVESLLIAVALTVKDIQVVTFCQVLGVCYCVLLGTGLLVIPVAYKLMQMGDDRAASGILRSMIRKNAEVGAGHVGWCWRIPSV